MPPVQKAVSDLRSRVEAQPEQAWPLESDATNGSSDLTPFYSLARLGQLFPHQSGPPVNTRPKSSCFAGRTCDFIA
ncbi:hypothetical protein JZ751_012807 [Albula glossodonta]|uniref:Uncharacterized protein n=1 Tax=Albula glossodonta TaxID=121402 RepID=A0A8T2N1M9_9TELE|nr:hypothetical protein JZ751_012807 [Albula glossodonta]